MNIEEIIIAASSSADSKEVTYPWAEWVTDPD